MRSLVLMTAAMVLFGSSSIFAQQIRSTSTRNAPAMPGMPTTSPTAAPGTIPTVGASSGTPLGAIQPNLGASVPISGSAMGTIMTCSPAGIAAAAASAFPGSGYAIGPTATLPPQPLPGATPPAISSFGTSMMTGGCNLTASVSNAIEALGSSIATPIPGLATATGPTYSDATIPTAATEVGGAGLSPLITVPTPSNALAPPTPTSPTTMGLTPDVASIMVPTPPPTPDSFTSAAPTAYSSVTLPLTPVAPTPDSSTAP